LPELGLDPARHYSTEERRREHPQQGQAEQQTEC
jgi:hypothetical protein